MTENKQRTSVDVYSREIEKPSGYKFQTNIELPFMDMGSEKKSEVLKTQKLTHGQKFGMWEYNLFYKIIEKHKSKGVCYVDNLNLIKIDDGLLFIKKELIEERIDYFRFLMKDKNCKIIIVQISYEIVDRNVAHANMLIIDKVREIVEIYEPQGSITGLPFYLDKLKNIIQCRDKLTKSLCFIPRRYKFLSRIESCPINGFQALESLGIPDKTIDLKGFCNIWNLFFLDLRLSNLYFDVRQIQTDFIKIFSGYDLENEDTIHELKTKQEIRNIIGKLFKEFIRNYSLYHMNTDSVQDLSDKINNISDYFMDMLRKLIADNKKLDNELLKLIADQTQNNIQPLDEYKNTGYTPSKIISLLEEKLENSIQNKIKFNKLLDEIYPKESSEPWSFNHKYNKRT